MNLDIHIQLVDTLYQTKRIQFQWIRFKCERPNFYNVKKI